MLQIDVAEIVVHEADEPNTVLDFFEAEELACEDGGDVDLLAKHADAAAGGDHVLHVVQRIAEFRKSCIGPG